MGEVPTPTEAIFTLGPNREKFWSISEKTILLEMNDKLPKIFDQVHGWIAPRYTLTIDHTTTYNEQYLYFPNSYSPIQLNPFHLPPRTESSLSRLRDALFATNIEANELLLAALDGKDVELSSELGDVAFWVAISDTSAYTDRFVGRADPNLDPNQQMIKNLWPSGVPDTEKQLLQRSNGLFSIYYATSMLSRLAYNEHAWTKIYINKINEYKDLVYHTVFRYALAAGIDIESTINETRRKNEENFPVELFKRISPFDTGKDAIYFLELLRTIPGYQRGITYYELLSNKLTETELRHLRNDHPADCPPNIIVKYRLFIQDLLKGITNSDTSYDNKSMAKFLTTSGIWTAEPTPVCANGPYDIV